MAKRLHDTEIWEQDWYIDLPNKYKLFWNYIKDKCDDSGVWRPNKSLLQRIIGEPINLDEFILFVNVDNKTRIVILPNGRWFLKEYFVFQYGDKFNPKSPVHRGALKRLLSHGVHPKELSKICIGKLQSIEIHELKEIAYQKDIDKLLVAYGYDSNRDKDKDKDKEYIKEEYISEEENEKKLCDMIVVEMDKIWKKAKPHYISDKVNDYHALLAIAYYVAEKKGIKKAAAISEKKEEVLKSWSTVSEYVVSHSFFKKLSLESLSKKMQDVLNSMQEDRNPSQRLNGNGSVSPSQPTIKLK